MAATQQMAYEVYGGGINAVSATMTIEDDKAGQYQIDFSAYTRGLLGRLAPWRGSFESAGWRDGDGFVMPRLHRSIAVWRGEEDRKEYHYDRNGNFLSYAETENGQVNDKDPDPALTRKTTDVMSATFNALHRVAMGQGCGGSAEIFDGSRRFTLFFRHDGDEDLKASRYNIYHGPAQRCIAEIEKGPGRWHKKPRGWISIQEQGRQRGGLPTIWFATITPGQPAIPVKVRVNSDYGAMFMHLTAYQTLD